MTPYQADQKAHRDLWERVQSLIVAPDRAAWKEFCEIDGENLNAGCAKYKQCPKHIKKIDERCWDREIESTTTPPFPLPGYSTLKNDRRYLPIVPPDDWRKLGSKSWCSHFAPLGSGEVKNKPVVAYSYGVICKECTNKEQDVALAGLYRQCSPPCPFTGCAVPKLTEKYEADAGPPLGCPYNPRTENPDEDRYLPNVFARVQCFISRAEFLRYQTEVLGLHMGFFAFIETRKKTPQSEETFEDLYYLARHAYKGLNLTQMVYDTRTGWVPDHYEHQKSYLFLASRELALPSQDGDSLLKRLRGPVEDSDKQPGNWRGFTEFDRGNQVLYVGDGEMSAFCLRWLLEEARNLWGQDGVEHDDHLNDLLDDLQSFSPDDANTDRPQWYPRQLAVASGEHEPRGWAVETLLADRYLLGRSSNDLTDLKNEITRIRANTKGVAPIIDFMGFEETINGLSLLEALGIVVRTDSNGEGLILATERFWRLIRYLQRYHDLNDPRLASAIARLVDLATDARIGGRFPRVRLTTDDCQFLLEWVATAPKLESSRAPFGRDGCAGHVMLRRTFKQEQGTQPQVETCARSWVAFPIFAYEPFQKRSKKAAESKQVGFFLGTFDDADCYQDDGVLDELRLSQKLFPIKQWMYLIGSVEASGTYFEDIVSRSEFAEGERLERSRWRQAIGNSTLLRTSLKSSGQNQDAEQCVEQLEQLIERKSEFLPLPLELSVSYERPEMEDLTHVKPANRFDSLESCIEAVKSKARALASDLELIKEIADSSSAGRRLLAWKVAVRYSNGTENLNLFYETSKQLQSIISIPENRHEELCGQNKGKWLVRESDDLKKLSAVRQAFRDAVTDPRAVKDDCLVPFVQIYGVDGAEIGQLIDRIKLKQTEDPDRFEIELPQLDGSDVSETLRGRKVKQSATVLKQINHHPEIDPKTTVGQILVGNTIPVIKACGLTDVVDVYVAVRAGNQIAMRSLERSWNRSTQHALLRAILNAPNASNDGVYWIMVLSWLSNKR